MTTENIQKTAGVCGGSARIKFTRIPVWLLESCRRNGATEKQILESYPHLIRDDLKNAWDYVTENLIEINEEIQENEKC